MASNGTSVPTSPAAAAGLARELRFACQPGCTNCCNVQGYVYLTEHNIGDAARFLGIAPEEFERRYVYRTRHLLRLRKPRHSQCHFLKDDGCSIHPVKPVQCRLFPFWPELVKSAHAWNLAARRCPGMGQGPLVQIGEALEVASEMKRAYPTIYP